MATKSDLLADPPARRSDLLSVVRVMPRWAVLLCAAVLVRAVTFGNPVVHVDEEFYFVTAQQMLHGALPYVDVWDRKPIGLFLVYVPAALFGVPAGIWVYQAMALASVVGTALLIARLAERAGWGKGALAAALLYVFMLGFGDGQGGQAPVFYNLLMAGAVLLIAPRRDDAENDRARVNRAMLAMGIVGIAMQIKYSVVFEAMFLGLWLLWREWQLGTSLTHLLRRGGVWAWLVWLPTIAAGLAYLALGHFDAWLYANFGSIAERQSDPPWVLIRAFLKVALILGPLLIVSGLSRHVPVKDRAEHPVRGLYFGWLIASVIGLLVFGGWFNHYALPVMVPASLCCSGFMSSRGIGQRLFRPAMPILAMIGGEMTVVSAMWHRGNAHELEALAEGIGSGPGCLYVHSGNAMLYSYTGRCAVTPWIFPSHLSRERENGALGVDQIAEVRRIFAQRPQIVAMRPEYFGERLAVRRVALAEMARLGYRLKGRWPLGDVAIAVYELPASATPRAPRLAARSP